MNWIEEEGNDCQRNTIKRLARTKSENEGEGERVIVRKTNRIELFFYSHLFKQIYYRTKDASTIAHQDGIA